MGVNVRVLFDHKVRLDDIAKAMSIWYNAGYSTPTNEFVPNELKIVEVILEIK
jgi:hypothetical protein